MGNISSRTTTESEKKLINENNKSNNNEDNKSNNNEVKKEQNEDRISISEIFKDEEFWLVS